MDLFLIKSPALLYQSKRHSETSMAWITFLKFSNRLNSRNTRNALNSLKIDIPESSLSVNRGGRLVATTKKSNRFHPLNQNSENHVAYMFNKSSNVKAAVKNTSVP